MTRSSVAMLAAVVMFMCVALMSACVDQAPENARKKGPLPAWGKELVSVHVTADDAIDAGDLAKAHAALMTGLAIDTSAVARQDLLQRIAWVEIKQGNLKDARVHADQAVALDDDDSSSYASALVSRYIVARKTDDQAKVEEMTEDLIEALEP